MEHKTSINTNLKWGQKIYLIADPEQNEHSLVGILFMPGKQCMFRLSYCGDTCDVYDFECSLTPDKEKLLNFRAKDDEEE